MIAQAYIVTYDIADPKRLRKVFKLMQGYGEHLQLSVFRCDLVPRQFAEMKARLAREIHDTEDQVLVVDMGPTDGRGAAAVEALGKPYAPRPRGAVIA